jgi:hypothetical protein
LHAFHAVFLALGAIKLGVAHVVVGDGVVEIGFGMACASLKNVSIDFQTSSRCLCKRLFLVAEGGGVSKRAIEFESEDGGLSTHDGLKVGIVPEYFW